MTLAVCLLTLGTFGCAKIGQQLGPAGMGGGGGVAGSGGSTGGNDGGTAGVFSIFDGSYEQVTMTCGNGILEGTEQCDDGNTVSGDGCSSTCHIEPHYTCPTPGKPCVHDVICGDGIIEGVEQCDDGNTKNGDGCSSTCTVECGWVCPPLAACRAAKCGDGLVAGNEQCDDGNTIDGDGCSSICTLENKPASVPEGWLCTSPITPFMSGADGGTDGGAAGGVDGGADDAADGGANGGGESCKGPTTCTTTVCGNGKVEGSEQCDDGNDVSGDGCSPFCRLEPNCPPGGGACTNVCGSGLIVPGDGKQCDDGNTVSGDGCSATCMIERGYTCKTVPVSQNPLILPIVYHDFQSWKDPSGHPDFEHYTCQGEAGIAQPMLSLTGGGVPVHVPMCLNPDCSSNLCTPPAGAMPPWNPMVDWFGMWYVDTPAYNKTIVQTLTLGGQVNGVPSTTCNIVAGQPACTGFQFSSTLFFPLDNVPGAWGLSGVGNDGKMHDFGFTSVTRYWFQYSGTATLGFFGDDDVYVYINKMLAVDLGATHQRADGGITLDKANGTGFSCDFVAPGPGNVSMGLAAVCDPTTGMVGHTVNLGLSMGNIYEIAVFQAERHTTESNYQLTLSNFSGSKSVCTGACGDGVAVPPEQCDLGAANNTGAYGGCNPNCTLAPYCGDGIVQPQFGEQCEPPGTPICSATCQKIVLP